MKIAHVINYYQPLAYQENLLAKKQHEMSHQVIIITSDRYNSGLKKLYKTNEKRIVGSGNFIENNINVVRLQTIVEIGTRVWLKGLKKALKEFNPDVVHCHDVFSILPVLAAVYKKSLGYRLVFDTHAADFNTDARSNWIRRLLYLLYRHTFGNIIRKRADAIIAIGENESTFICREMGLAINEVGIIRMGADSEMFKFSFNARKENRKYLGIQENELLIIHTGKLSPNKDVDILIKAFLKVAKQCNNIKLLIIGEGDKDYLDYLKALAKSADILNSIIFHPFVETSELAGYYSAADIAVWPGNPTISFFEAMSVGLPLIVCSDPYNIGTLSNKNAIFFKRGSIEELYKFLICMIKDKNLRETMAKKSRELIVKELNWDVLAKRFEKVYQGLPL